MTVTHVQVWSPADPYTTILDTTEICPQIHAPTLVLRGETDRVCPRDWVSEVARLLPRGCMREIQGRGHEAIIKSAEPVGSMILEFTESPAGR